LNRADTKSKTIRIATQPFPEYTKGLTTEQAVAFFKQYDALAATEKFAASIGPAMVNAGDSDSQANLLAEILSQHEDAECQPGGRERRRRELESGGRGGSGDEETRGDGAQPGQFSFCGDRDGAAADAVFFRRRITTDSGINSRSRWNRQTWWPRRFKDAPDLAAAKQRLTDSLAASAFDIERHAGRVDQDTGWTYMGIDLSPAPSGNVSIGAAIENLTTQPVGMSGTLTAAGDDYRGGQRRQSEANRIYRLDASHPGRFAASRSVGAKGIFH